MSSDRDKFIIRNTIYLYLRMFVTMAVSIYSSRVVLEVLGVRDYGIYNVVGGVVVILSFLNATMSGTTQRFLNFEMGKGDRLRLRNTFAAAWKIHLWLALIVLIAGETIGVWLVNHYLVIAPERLSEANLVFQYSLLGALAAVLVVPFNGALFANERFGVFAIVQLAMSFLKLGLVVALLYVATIDNLVCYAAGIAAIQCAMSLLTAVFCLKAFPECSLSVRTDKGYMKALIGYSSADLAGNTFYVTGIQGALVVINRVGGTVLNAAAGVTTTVSGALCQFGQSIIMAFRPQIISEYAAGNIDRMMQLMVSCSKYSLLLYSLFAIPVFAEMDYILHLWLTEVPPHSADFCRLVLVSSGEYFTVQTLNAGMHATGDILKFSICTGLTYVVNLPVMYLLMVWTGNVNWAYIVPIVQLMAVVAMTGTMLHNRVAPFSLGEYVRKGILLPGVVIVITGSACVFLGCIVPQSFHRLIITTLLSTVVLVGLSWTAVLTPAMRTEVVSVLKKKLGLRPKS